MSGWPNKRARAYLGGDPPGLGEVTAIGSGREHVFWCVSCRRLDRASQKTSASRFTVQHVERQRALPRSSSSGLANARQGVPVLPRRARLALHHDVPAAVLRRVRRARGGSFLSNVLCCLCKCFGCWHWVDGEFEGDKALGLPAKTEDIKWVRARELSVAKQAKGGMKLFRGIEPDDVCQGALGDCWLVGAMAGMAEYPAAVRNCFVNAEASELGKYQIRLWCGRAERWETVTVDDSFPVRKNPQVTGTTPCSCTRTAASCGRS